VQCGAKARLACAPGGTPLQDHDIYKRRLSRTGQPLDAGEKHEVGPKKAPPPATNETVVCGSCYGAGDDGECCNSCEEVCLSACLSVWVSAMSSWTASFGVLLPCFDLPSFRLCAACAMAIDAL
jgi:hypothetical protein